MSDDVLEYRYTIDPEAHEAVFEYAQRFSAKVAHLQELIDELYNLDGCVVDGYIRALKKEYRDLLDELVDEVPR